MRRGWPACPRPAETAPTPRPHWRSSRRRRRPGPRRPIQARSDAVTTAIAALQAPDLPELTPVVPAPGDSGDLELSGARVSGSGAAVAARRARVRESELEGLRSRRPTPRFQPRRRRDARLQPVRPGRLRRAADRVAMHGCSSSLWFHPRRDPRPARDRSSLQLACSRRPSCRPSVRARQPPRRCFMDARLEAVALSLPP